MASYTVGTLIPSLSTYSPISTLERQYAGYNNDGVVPNDSRPPPPGQTTSAGGVAAPAATTGKRYLFLQVNANCCVPLEQVFRVARGRPPATTTTTTTTPFDTASTTTTTTTTTIEDHPDIGNNGKDPFAFLPSSSDTSVTTTDGTDTVDTTTTSTTTTTNFASVVDPAAAVAGATQRPTSRSSRSSRSSRFGRLFQTIKETGSHAITAGMHSLAVRTAGVQEGAASECLLIAALDPTSTNNTVVLGATEPKSMMIMNNGGFAATAAEGNGGDDLVFAVPIPLVHPLGKKITLCLCVKSTAALVSSKHYYIGSVSLDISSLSSSSNQYGILPIVNSPLIVDGRVTYWIVPDGKRLNFCLPDPIVNATSFRSSSASSATALPSSIHNLPLDQRYAFRDTTTTTMTTGPNNNRLLLATEKTVESTVILPVAAALGTLYDMAARASLKHAHEQYRFLHEYRHDVVPSSSSSSSFMAPAGTMPPAAAPPSPSSPALLPAHNGYYADVQLRISHWQTNTASSSLITVKAQHRPTITMFYQRPDSLFETTIQDITPLALYPTAADGFRKVIAPRFFANAIGKPDVMPSVAHNATVVLNNNSNKNNANVVALGTLRLEVTLRSTTEANDGAGGGNGGSFREPEDRFDCFIPLEPLLLLPPSPSSVNDAAAAAQQHYQQQPQQQSPFPPHQQPQRPSSPSKHHHGPNHHREYKLYDGMGQCMGTIVLSSLSVTLQQTPPPPVTQPLQPAAAVVALASSASMDNGLAELMGLVPVTDGICPSIDVPDATLNVAVPILQRRQQLKQLGIFYTSAYLEQHLNTERSKDVEQLAERATQYKEAIQMAMRLQSNNAGSNTTDNDNPPVYADRRPRPFRPSSSRITDHLAGLGFNVHTATMSLAHHGATTTSDNTNNDPRQPPGSLPLFHNVTCGAPADHARGFGKLYDAPGSSAPVAGGLRRLEAARQTIGQHITALQNALLLKALRYLEEQSMACKRPVTHISPNHEELRILRWKLFEAVQCLHALTWTCAVRRTSVFSQALGIALTSYLAHVSDPSKCASHWPEVWSRHGFLVSYEGLLSAAGKELGMIEDAAVGVDMLRRVRVILAPDDGGFAKNPHRVPVPFSQSIPWIHLWTVRERPGAPLEFILQVGIDPTYFTPRVPAPLKNGTAVRLLGTLFEVGVDIFQAASNAGSNLNKNMSTAACNPVDFNDAQVQEYAVKDVLSDTEDDAVNGSGGDMDDDEDLTGDTTGISGTDALVQLNYEAFQKLNAYAHAVCPVAPFTPKPTGTHPMLATLYQHIASSAGKVNHDILVEASMLAQQLGGGGVVFCKSGKDRTAMHVTYKQTQLLQSVLQQPSEDELLRTANLIRLYGTRLPICEKNVGHAKYAFNSLQVKFMPRALKPPMSALAGFLKGGKVFGGGGIES